MRIPVSRAIALGAALALVGGVTAATTAIAQTSPGTGTAAHGNTNIDIYSINSDGPDFQAVLSGAIGDFGPAVAVFPDGTVDPEHSHQLQLNLSRGSFRLDIVQLEQDFLGHLSNFPAYPGTCSEFVGFTLRVPVVAGSGTGAYQGISGEFTVGVTGNEALLAAPGSGPGQPCKQPQGRAWEVIIVNGHGTVSLS